MMTPPRPLVSVYVITYNSSKTIVETLDSIYHQTYQNIELIISDDCSADNTVDLCKNWMAKNDDRFTRTEIIESPTNTGIAANCNRAEDVCHAKWVKPLAGDDILLPDCIDTYMNFVKNQDDSPCIFCRVQCFNATTGENIYSNIPFDYSFFSKTRERQLSHLIYDGNCIPAASVFINIHLLRKLGIRNDERIPLLEDWPKWINILNAGYHLNFLDKTLVKYRMQNGTSTSGLNPDFYYSVHLFTLLYRYPEWKKRDPVDAYRRLRLCMGDDKPSLGVRDRRNLQVGRFILKPIYIITDYFRQIKRQR